MTSRSYIAFDSTLKTLIRMHFIDFFDLFVVSAFYAEHQTKRITLDGYIWTKSKFLGLSIGVHMIGQGVVSVIDHDEEYVITFPNGYGRSVLIYHNVIALVLRYSSCVSLIIIIFYKKILYNTQVNKPKSAVYIFF